MNVHNQNRSTENNISKSNVQRTDYVSLSKPTIIGFMSVDAKRHYHPDLSQLKFLNSATNGPTSLNLNHNIDAAIKRTTENNDEKIDLLLRFIIDRKQLLMNHIDFITYRRTLISIMCSAFHIKEPITIEACSYKDSIYLLSVESQHEILRKRRRTKDVEKYCAWGYKFEQFLLSDEPNLDPDIERPVFENEEFSICYKASLRNLELLYGAQIDGLLTSMSTCKVPTTKDYDTNISYLESNNFVELKTNREIYNFKQERNFKRYKLLRCWCQCYLANLKGLYVGYRNSLGIVQRLQWFDTEDISTYCKNEWNPQVAINYLHYFLTQIKNSFRVYKQKEPITLRFYLNLDGKITVSECNDSILLPSWFIKNV